MDGAYLTISDLCLYWAYLVRKFRVQDGHLVQLETPVFHIRVPAWFES